MVKRHKMIEVRDKSTNELKGYKNVDIPEEEVIYDEPCIRCGEIKGKEVDFGHQRFNCISCQEIIDEENIEMFYYHANISKRYRACDFDTYKITEGNVAQAKAVQTCKVYSQNFSIKGGENLILLGSVGTGKTHMANAILIDVRKRKRIVGRYQDFLSLIKMIKRSFGSKSNGDLNESELMRQVLDSPLLILDELGHKTSDSDWENTVLFEIINHRYNENKSTIVVSNKNQDGLRKVLGERAFSRISEHGETVYFNWQDYRTNR